MLQNETKHIKILLIDDDLEDMQFFRDALAEYQSEAQVDWLQDSATFPSFIADKQVGDYDVIFLDIKMPHIDGINCLKTIREMESLGNVPVIMFSTYNTAEYIRDSYAGGANLYVQKPFDFAFYNLVFNHIFCSGWQSKLMNGNRKTYLYVTGDSVPL